MKVLEMMFSLLLIGTFGMLIYAIGFQLIEDAKWMYHKYFRKK